MNETITHIPIKESLVVSAAIQWCWNQPTVMAWRHNTGGVKIGKAFVRFGFKGSGDVLGIIEGRGLSIECKGRDKKGNFTSPQSDEQKEFQVKWEANGGIYLLVSGTDQIIEQLTELGYNVN